MDHVFGVNGRERQLVGLLERADQLTRLKRELVTSARLKGRESDIAAYNIRLALWRVGLCVIPRMSDYDVTYE